MLLSSLIFLFHAKTPRIRQGAKILCGLINFAALRDKLIIRIVVVQECDATEANQGINAGIIIILTIHEFMILF
jgi:hypothetical protein